MIGEAAMLMTDRELQLIYGGANSQSAHVGDAATGPDDPAPYRRRPIGQQALRGARHHRRRQVERRRDPAAAHPRRAAGPAHLPDRPAQRIRPLLRRQGPGAHSAQPAAAVLAVQFRGDDRRLLRRPARHRRRGRDPLARLSRWRRRSMYNIAIPRTAADQEDGPANQRLRRRYAGALPHRGSDHAASTSAWASSKTAARA